MAMTDKETRTEHPSFGLLSVSRVSGRARLFGTSIEHYNTIRLTISRAEQIRNLNCDRYHPARELIEIEMSPVQWAEAISTMNCGVGTPVTLKHIAAAGEVRIPECPFTDKREQIKSEFSETVSNAAGLFRSVADQVKERFADKKPLTMAEKQEIVKSLERVVMEMGSNVAFVQSQFNRSVEHTIAQAKCEVEAFIANKILTAGMAALGIEDQAPRLLIEDQSDEV